MIVDLSLRETHERILPDSYPAGLSFRGPSLVFSAGTWRRDGPGNRDKGKRDAVGIRGFPAGGPRRADGWSARDSVSVPSQENNRKGRKERLSHHSLLKKNAIFALVAPATIHILRKCFRVVQHWNLENSKTGATTNTTLGVDHVAGRIGWPVSYRRVWSIGRICLS